VGARFWQTLLRLLVATEDTLARWCVHEPGVDAAALRQLFPADVDATRPELLDANAIDGLVDPAAYRALWGRWHGREREFFGACARRVQALTWKCVAAVGGPNVRLWARMTADAFADLTSKGLPNRLMVGKLQTAPCGDGFRGWSRTDPPIRWRCRRPCSTSYHISRVAPRARSYGRSGGKPASP
jgi:hypothetical protein